ncbi:MAG: ATP-dependent DNA helicase RecG [Patescibacteria group bacterium]|nr:ATP-dependent DNA helicase RecG [Patescibacteria group bacterium]
MEQDQKIENLPRTSLSTIRKLKTLGIKTYFELLNYFPFRYQDYSVISTINLLQPGEKVTIVGKVVDSQQIISQSGLKIQKFLVTDDTGQVEAIFYNQSFLLTMIKKNLIVSFSGGVEIKANKIIFLPTEYEIGKPTIHTGRIVPIYVEKKGLSSRTIREKIKIALESVEIGEILPEEVRKINHLIGEKEAYQKIHFPSTKKEIAQARERLAFDELFIIQLSSTLVRKSWQKEKLDYRLYLLPEIEKIICQFINQLPFRLTSDQRKVWEEILSDLQKTSSMNRLLQGDVGSGKTVVAILAAYFVYLNHFRTLLMAPTEILAQQHYQTFIRLFSTIDQDYRPKISLISRNHKLISEIDTPGSKEDLEKKIFESDIIIGTQALISRKKSYDRVGLVIIDEQHRFGVKQRAELKKKGLNPHLLTMTATPIPRTVALTLYGELDFSFIEKMPENRLPVKTYYIPPTKRKDCYEWIKRKIKDEKAQVFVICPLIDQSDKETMKSVKAAKKEYENLSRIFSEFKLVLLHGKMKQKEKEIVMKKFSNHEFDILVTTPVVEVGIDIPEATIIIIEAAERFGLAQLHQLRGRVGRGSKQSYCFLFCDKETKSAIDRLKIITRINNGAILAQKDLELRGPGEIYGTRQHGFFELKIASFSDLRLIEKTKKTVYFFISNNLLQKFPSLVRRISSLEIQKISPN